MTAILITKDNCQKCDYVKEKIPEGMDITILDANTPEGMSHMAYHEVLKRPVPLLITPDEEVVEGAIKIKHELHSIWKNNGGSHDGQSVPASGN